MITNTATPTFLAYIGPGAGLAISVSFLTILLVTLSVVLGPVAFPLAMLWHLLRRRRVRYRPGLRKVVVLGLDGLDPKLLRQLMDQGKLPHFSSLAALGHFSDLQTVAPPITPAAWSSFMTGKDPSYHGIFDFIAPDPHTYLPKLSSCQLHPPRRTLRIGPLHIPLSSPHVRMLRKGIPFWQTLARHGLESTILRVPITFPPEPFPGRLLSGMCLPDLLGTQGTYTCFSSQIPTPNQHIHLQFRKGIAKTHIPGPPHPFIPGKQLTLPLIIRKPTPTSPWHLKIANQHLDLQPNTLSPWVPLTFHAFPIKIRGLVQFYASSNTDRIYMTPIHLDPEHPPMPISHPPLFSNHLAKRTGSFGTLGFIEDTSALNDGVLDPAGFLQQAWHTFAQRKQMFLHALQTQADHLLVCVFDTPDRIQHMFWRQHRQYHPSDPIEQMMIEMDNLLGQTLSHLSPDALLLVLSDHGFTSFDRSVHLNAWLHQHGYLHLLPDAPHNQDWLQSVDWSRTRAYALGLAGIYINLHGRESAGIVQPGPQCDALLAELKTALENLQDLPNPHSPIRRVLITRQHYSGPYHSLGPDLLIGYNAGYRCSWESARGQITDAVFTDNTRPWSGDHCVDPDLVPGVLLCNRKLNTSTPSILDIAPTILDAFGIPPDSPMPGISLLPHAQVEQTPCSWTLCFSPNGTPVNSQGRPPLDSSPQVGWAPPTSTFLPPSPNGTPDNSQWRPPLDSPSPPKVGWAPPYKR